MMIRSGEGDSGNTRLSARSGSLSETLYSAITVLKSSSGPAV